MQDIMANKINTARNGNNSSSIRWVFHWSWVFPRRACIEGSPNVYAGGMRVARVGDKYAAHSCGTTVHPTSNEKYHQWVLYCLRKRHFVR